MKLIMGIKHNESILMTNSNFFCKEGGKGLFDIIKKENTDNTDICTVYAEKLTSMGELKSLIENNILFDETDQKEELYYYSNRVYFRYKDSFYIIKRYTKDYSVLKSYIDYDKMIRMEIHITRDITLERLLDILSKPLEKEELRKKVIDPLFIRD